MAWDPVVAPWWDDKPTAIIANGTSIKGFDMERLRGRFHVLAVKGMMFNIPWADAGFGIDTPRYREWKGMLNRVSFPVYWAVPELKHAGDPPHAPCVRFIRRIDLSDLSEDPKAICCGGSSGFGAFNLARLKRAKEILLLGFDYDADKKGHADGRAYIEGRSQDESRWRAWSKNFGKIKRRLDLSGIKVINASPDSRIPTFPKMSIEDALNASDLYRVRPQGG